MDKIKLGEQPEENQKRDAIHMAVMPVRTAHSMRPGAHVGLDKSGRASEEATPHIGIIDPFYGTCLLSILKQLGTDKTIGEGQPHWLLLYPGTISSLRHEWSHPVVDDVAADKPAAPTDKAASIAWMEDYVARHCPYYIECYHGNPQNNTKHDAYLRFMQRVAEGEVFYSGTDLHGLNELEDADEFFKHLSVILGRTVSGEDFEYSCSC